MLNPLKLLSKVFKSSNQKELGRIQKIVDKINNFEKNISEYSNSDFTKKTAEFIKKINEGKSLDEIFRGRDSISSYYDDLLVGWYEK